jgi:hypothetical protein
MRCEECRAEATGLAEGWRGLRTDIPDEGDEPEVAFYCPECAEREFELDPPRRYVAMRRSRS